MNAPGPFTSAPNRPLQGRAALITGSTSGVGLGIARALAAKGADVILNGLGDPEAISQAQAAISRDFGVLASYGEADLRDPDAIARLFDDITASGPGRLDILVNNAGLKHVAPTAQVATAQWDQILALNLTAAFHTIRLAIPLMRQGGYGRIINIASARGLAASPFKSAYVAAKHGLIGLTRTAALETAEERITCNVICPGYGLTPGSRIEDQATVDGVGREPPAGRTRLAGPPDKGFGAVEAVGALTAFLCTEGAASITGAALPADGGWTTH